MVYAGHAASLGEILQHQGNEPNLFYTVSAIQPAAFPSKIGTPWKPTIRDFAYTDYLAFDIDGILPIQDLADVEQACETLAPPLGIFQSTEERHYIASGHGLHWLIRIPRQSAGEFFTNFAARYRLACHQLTVALLAAKIEHKQVDPTIFEASRLLRVPGSINRKDGKEPVPCRLIESLGAKL